jgi:NTF2 fold immunity protein of polymorphic toxin system component
MTVKGPIPSVIVLTFSFVALLAADEGKHNYKPGTGYVPDAATAIKIAIAVWEPIYGAAHIAGERRYHAVLRNEIWTVEGSLPTNTLGGVAVAEISKDDGRILRVSYGK